MKKFIKFLILFLLFSLPISLFLQVQAQETVEQITEESAETNNKLEINFFYGADCPHCKKEKPFLEKLEQKYAQSLSVNKYEVYYDKENQDIFMQFAQDYNIQNPGVPVTFIGDEYVIGFGSEDTTGKKIEDIVKRKLNIEDCTDDEKTISIPVLGEINPKQFSLPVLSVVLGLLDGFNPCAMWTLIFLISLLLGMEDKFKMWILGISFILTSALIYFLFMTAWLNLFISVGYIIWIRIIIGLVALASGIYNLKDFLVNKDGGCKTTNKDQKKKITQKMKEVVSTQNFFLALGGIILLAISVNMVELVCSAGLPAIFTSVLTQSDLPTFQYYMYLFVYILFFTLDDLIIFVTAMVTLKLVGIQGKFSRWSRLIGGIVIFILGILLLFKPEWVMFA